MLFDSYSIIVEFINESTIDIMYDFVNYIKDILNHGDISFVTSYMISIDGIDTVDEAEAVINKLKNLYLPDFKINGYRSFRILHAVCKEVAIYNL